jgi:hypothetical protein
MAKKKSKKQTKQAEVAFLSDDPTPKSEDLELSESNPDDAVQPIAAPTESTVEDPVVEASEIEPASEDSVAEDATVVEQEDKAEVAVDETVETILIPEPAIEHEVAEEPSETASIEQGTSDPELILEPPAPSNPSLLDPAPSPVHRTYYLPFT